MITIILPVYAGSYLVILDQTPTILSGDPDSVALQLNTGFFLMESSGFIIQENNSILPLE